MSPPKRTRAERAGLSREQVLDAALDLVDRDGADALSMRRLGAELGVEAMTLYHYLPSKDALLDGIVERVMAQAETGLADGPWDQALTSYARSLRATLLRHPGAALLVATRPAVTPETLRTAERGLTLLCDAGFPVGQACPSCGAPYEPAGETVKCRYCGALLCSGEHDWVLAEITQLVEWQPRIPRDVGVEALRRSDPGVAREVLEDRGSYVFWKWVQAGRSGEVSPLRKCASPPLLAGPGLRLEATRGASDVAVGGADLVGCELGGRDGFDRVYVEILWSARFGRSPAPTPSRVVMRLARRTGALSRLSMTALACQACGAPLMDSDSTRCDHCGVELAAGDQAWVLDAVLEPGPVS